ncbi:hypothetical protein [Brevibacillus centrosporus]|uniref:hypothetical protein n=1 Tax=Brevibacillus centrosporus TaxID=54910 RepID=UPI002E1C3114|nr:hypothetical protein [Brevibacillus centrosporus]
MTGVMLFHAEGWDGVSHFVGKQKEYTKEAFFNECGLDFEDCQISPSLSDVEERYCRFYPKMPEGFEIESGYTFCDKAPGAFAVWTIDVRSIRQRDCDHDYLLRKGYNRSMEWCRKCQHHRDVITADAV